MAQTATFRPRTAAARTKAKPAGVKGNVSWAKMLITIAIGAAIWFIPAPAGLEATAWHLFAISVATIVGLIIKPVPMGVMAIAAIAMCVLTGTVVLLLGEVLTWDDVKSEKGAWDTLVWFSALVMMAGQLSTLGLIPWFGDLMSASVGGMNWAVALLVLLLAYFSPTTSSQARPPM